MTRIEVLALITEEVVRICPTLKVTTEHTMALFNLAHNINGHAAEKAIQDMELNKVETTLLLSVAAETALTFGNKYTARRLYLKVIDHLIYSCSFPILYKVQEAYLTNEATATVFGIPGYEHIAKAMSKLKGGTHYGLLKTDLGIILSGLTLQYCSSKRRYGRKNVVLLFAAEALLSIRRKFWDVIHGLNEK